MNTASHVSLLENRTTAPLLVVFADLTRYSAESARRPDEEIADAMSRFYELADARISGAGGTVIKTMGDAVLAVFAPEHADAAVVALLDLKDEVDAYFDGLGWSSRLIVKAHVGPVVAGPFGPPDKARFDVLGKAVNAAAMLESTGVALSVAAFRALGPEVRQRFKKHTPEVTYIRAGDPHRARR